MRIGHLAPPEGTILVYVKRFRFRNSIWAAPSLEPHLGHRKSILGAFEAPKRVCPTEFRNRNSTHTSKHAHAERSSEDASWGTRNELLQIHPKMNLLGMPLGVPKVGFWGGRGVLQKMVLGCSRGYFGELRGHDLETIGMPQKMVWGWSQVYFGQFPGGASEGSGCFRGCSSGLFFQGI